jgi:ammonia channel protein AmtB
MSNIKKAFLVTSPLLIGFLYCIVGLISWYAGWSKMENWMETYMLYVTGVSVVASIILFILYFIFKK